jgi:hypothetical protein
VTLDATGNVMGVGSCPLCSSTDFDSCLLTYQGTWVEQSQVPEATVAEARKALIEFKQQPRYREQRERFKKNRSLPHVQASGRSTLQAH